MEGSGFGASFRGRYPRSRAWLAALIALGALACGEPSFPPARVVDLTHPFDETTVYWPTSPPFVLETITAGVTPDGFYYAANRFHAAEHGGTHVDAPIHFSAEGRRVGDIPAAEWIGPGVRIDVSAACQKDRDHRVRVDELEAWEARHGRIPEGALVLLDTGSARFWPDRERYLGTAERGPKAVAKLHFPGLSAEAARWLAEERRVRAVGIDTASIDPGISRRFEAHQVLAAHQIPALENLTRLDALPARGFWVVALPMLIREGTGAPLRAVALLP